MIFLTFANGWKYRENRDKQIPQNSETYHTVTLPWVEILGNSCGMCSMPSENFTLFHT